MNISSYLPDLIDNYISLRAQRLNLDKEVAIIKEQEEGLKQTIISKFREGEIKAMGAKNGLVKLHEAVEPVAENWPDIWEHIKATGQWELMHKRLTSKAVKEHWEEGEEIPGVGRTTVFSISVSKV